MPVSTFFCSRATDASLASLKKVVDRLQFLTNTLPDIESNGRSKVKDAELNEVEDNNNLNEDNDLFPDFFRKKLINVPVKSGVRSRSPSEKWGILPEKLGNLYNYLNENKNSYYYNYLANIAKKSEMMVNKIDDYFKEEDKGQKEIKLREAKTAIKEFHSAFELSQTRNTILAGLVFAIIGAILGLFAGFLSIPAVIGMAGGGTTIGYAGFKNLFFGNIANLKKLADESREAAENLLANKDEKTVSVSQKNCLFSSPSQYPKKSPNHYHYPSPDGFTQQDLGVIPQENSNEEGIIAYLRCLLNSLKRSCIPDSGGQRPFSPMPTHRELTGEKRFTKNKG